jgi:S-adenosylmethionine hydrolase
MEQPVIALLTDFGEEDSFVASLRGVILTINPSIRLVDISHAVPAFDITAGALLLRSCYSYFPEGTIFLAVVDPGVGSARRLLLAEGKGYRFLGPDNGLLDPVLQACRDVRPFAVTNTAYFLPSPSATFEARDKMAPAAAWLSKGVPPDKFGARLKGWTALDIPLPRRGRDSISGQVITRDRFGNLTTNIVREDVEGLGGDPDNLRLEIAGQVIPAFVRNYASVPAGRPLFLIGSSGYLEVAVSCGSAASALSAGIGEKVKVVKVS